MKMRFNFRFLCNLANKWLAQRRKQLSTLRYCLVRCVGLLLMVLSFWIHERYIDCCQWLVQVRTKLEVGYVKMINYREPSRIVAATTAHHPFDATLIIRYFYAHDRMMTTSSMYRWLRHFTTSYARINILFVKKGYLYSAKLDLESDMELHTDSQISEVYLDALPCMKLMKWPKHRAQSVL